jgi:tRNA(fMet)-specific endonuclease VapC
LSYPIATGTRGLAYLIDTNIAIHARDGAEQVLDKLAEHDGAVLLSALSLVELQRGLYKDPAYTALRQARLDVLLRHIPVLPFDAAAAQAYGQIIAQRGWIRGRDYDRMIAAHAIASGSVLVTDNSDDFKDVPGLSIENWAGEV